MDKLIKTKQVPIFDQEVIKKGMFITVKNNDCDPINGIVSLVTESKIYYIDRNDREDKVLISCVTEGTTQIQVADSLKPHPVTHIIKEASTGVSIGYARLNLVTNDGNQKVVGVLYNEVVVDGVVYTPKSVFKNTITSDSVKSVTISSNPSNLY